MTPERALLRRLVEWTEHRNLFDTERPLREFARDARALLAEPEGIESRLLAAEARVRELQAPVMCSVCVGRPLPSGRPCICGDTIRTEAAEMHGLRVRCFELEDENATLRADRDALVPLARDWLGNDGLTLLPHNITREQVQAARAILDRLDKDGA